MSSYQKTLIVVFAIVILVVSVALILVLQNNVSRKTQQIQAQEPAAIEANQVDVDTLPPTSTPIPAAAAFFGSPVPTQPVIPKTREELDEETEYLESLLNETSGDEFEDSELNLE